MSDIFARLNHLSLQLNKSSDSLAQEIAKVEGQFSALRLGIPVWVEEPIETYTEFDESNNMSWKVEVRLGYAKHEGKWGLCLSEFHDGPDHYEFTSLPQAPRSRRLRAIESLPKLVEAFEKEAEQTIKDVESARKTIEEVLNPGSSKKSK